MLSELPYEIFDLVLDFCTDENKANFYKSYNKEIYDKAIKFNKKNILNNYYMLNTFIKSKLFVANNVTLYISEPKDFECLNYSDQYKYSKNIIINIDENLYHYLPKNMPDNIKKIIYPMNLTGYEFHTELLKNKGNIEIEYKKPTITYFVTRTLFLSLVVYLFVKICK